MRRSIAFVFLPLLLALVAPAAEMKGPPRYILMQYEQLQAGKTATYMQLAESFAKMMEGSPHYWLAGAPIVGSGPEFAAVYVSFADSFAEVDRMMADYNVAGAELTRKNSALVNDAMSAILSMRSVIAEFQPELSLNVDKIESPQITRWVISTYRLRPGTRAKFTQLLDRVRHIEEGAHNPASVLVYRVEVGEPGPVFLVMRPLKTLADLDQEPRAPENPLSSAIVGEQFAVTVAECVVSQTEAIYQVLPNLSHPPESYVAANPGFWKVKPAEASVTPPANKGKKAVQPAALKDKQ